MLPITHIIISEGIDDSYDDIITFKCKECNIECEAHVESNGDISIYKLCMRINKLAQRFHRKEVDHFSSIRHFS